MFSKIIQGILLLMFNNFTKSFKITYIFMKRITNYCLHIIQISFNTFLLKKKMQDSFFNYIFWIQFHNSLSIIVDFFTAQMVLDELLRFTNTYRATEPFEAMKELDKLEFRTFCNERIIYMDFLKSHSEKKNAYKTYHSIT